jgi:hypothetical protein
MMEAAPSTGSAKYRQRQGLDGVCWGYALAVLEAALMKAVADQANSELRQGVAVRKHGQRWGTQAIKTIEKRVSGLQNVVRTRTDPQLPLDVSPLTVVVETVLQCQLPAGLH